tara:strand:- start:330 stop:1010 length:681 start_codon:yes stop_codon:yes gene_type:complete
VKNYLKKNRFILNLRNTFRSYNLAKNNKGQMRVDTEPGKLLSNFILNNQIEKVLEIGTWNGLGSTSTILNSLKRKNNNYEFTSLESDKIFYKRAVKNLKIDKQNINLKLGRIIEISDLPSIKDINFEKHGLIKENKEWFIQDIRRYKKIKNILNELSNNYDFILFDGGEFSTYSEFLTLYKRTLFFGLDDIKTFKQYDVLKYIESNKNKFEHIVGCSSFSIYKVIA